MIQADPSVAELCTAKPAYILTVLRLEREDGTGQHLVAGIIAHLGELHTLAAHPIAEEALAAIQTILSSSSEFSSWDGTGWAVDRRRPRAKPCVVVADSCRDAGWEKAAVHMLQDLAQVIGIFQYDCAAPRKAKGPPRREGCRAEGGVCWFGAEDGCMCVLHGVILLWTRKVWTSSNWK